MEIFQEKEFRIDYVGIDISGYSEVSPQSFRDSANFQEISSQLSLELEEAKVEKFLTLWGTFARIGNQIYLDSQGNVRVEHRSEEEVIKSLDSFRNKPISLDHPHELILSSNSRKYARGISHEDIIYDRGLSRIRITLTDADAIQAIQNSHRQLSAGYLAKVLEQKGDWHGDSYTHVQKDIYGNHIALVETGRAGNLVITHLGREMTADSVNNISIPLAIQLYRVDGLKDTYSAIQEENIGNAMPPVKDSYVEATMTNLDIDGVSIQVSEAAAIAINSKFRDYQSTIELLKSEVAELTASSNGSQIEMDSINGQIKVQSLEIEKLKSDLLAKDKLIADATDPKVLQGMIRERVELEKQGEKILGSTVSFDSMDNQGIQKAVLQKLYGDKLSVSDAELTGAFKVAISQHSDTNNPAQKGIVASQQGVHNLAQNSTVLDSDDELTEDAIAERQFEMYRKNATAPLSASAANARK